MATKTLDSGGQLLLKYRSLPVLCNFAVARVILVVNWTSFLRYFELSKIASKGTRAGRADESMRLGSLTHYDIVG